MSSPGSEDDVTRRSKIPWLALAFLPSLVLHGAAYASLGAPRSRVAKVPANEVSFLLAPRPEAPPLPEPPARPEPEPEPEPSRAPLPPRPVALPAAPAPPRATEAPPPLDLRGLTLTNGAGAFAMSAGNALPLDRPIGTSPAAAPASAAAPGPRPPAPPAMVALDALGTRPAPPPLEAALRRNYPADARRRALGGTARVLARIDGDGVARNVSIVSETYAGFGEACRRTLAGSRWSPPRDDTGRPVATQVRYTCRFEVEP